MHGGIIGPLYSVSKLIAFEGCGGEDRVDPADFMRDEKFDTVGDEEGEVVSGMPSTWAAIFS